MNVLPRYLFFVLAMTLGLMATLLKADQIRQPASVLPWQATPVEVALVLKGPLPADVSTTPSWLPVSPEPHSKPSRSQKDLPMVETENYSHLGQLQAGSSRPRETWVPRDQSSNKSAPSKPFNFFRSIGSRSLGQRNGK